jgi:hypothetical protein
VRTLLVSLAIVAVVGLGANALEHKAPEHLASEPVPTTQKTDQRNLVQADPGSSIYIDNAIKKTSRDPEPPTR